MHLTTLHFEFRIWDVSTGAVCMKLSGHAGAVTQVKILEDGTQIVLSSMLNINLHFSIINEKAT